MKPIELQAILRNPKKLSLKKIKHIIYELKKDCYDEIYKLQNENPPNLIKIEQDGMTSIRATLQNVGREEFLTGAADAFYICLDLLDKLEVDDGKKENSTN